MFTFKNKNSDVMKVYAREETFLGKAGMTYDTIHIDGKDGDEVINLGYENYVSSLSDVVIMDSNFDEVMEWLNGYGELIYRDKKTYINFLDTYEVGKHNKPFNVPYIRDSFWYKVDDDWQSIDTSTGGGSIENEGSVYSKPLIKLVNKTVDKVKLEINGINFEYDFKGESEVIIDCEKMNAYKDNLLRNRQLIIGFDFPYLKVGANDIKVISGEVDVSVKRKDRWL